MNILQETQKHFSLRHLQERAYDLFHFEKAGSHSGFAKSAQYCADALADAGFQDIEKLTFPADGVSTAWDCTMPQAWELTGRSTLEVVEGDMPESSRTLADTAANPIHALPWSAPTPPEGLNCEMVDFDSLDAKEPQCQGKCVLLNVTPGSVCFGPAYRKLALAGARCIAVTDLSALESAPDDLIWFNGQGKFGWYPVKEDIKLPAYSIAPRHAFRLKQALQQGKITVHAVMQARLYDGESYAITGVIPGESKEEYVLVAHLYEPFVCDDAIGFATACEFGRELTERGVKLKKTLRVVCAMELYGMAAFFSQKGRRKNILGAMSLDSIVTNATEQLIFRHTPASTSHCLDWFFQDWLGKHLPELTIQQEWASLSDDTFLNAPTFHIPTNWVATPFGKHHHSTGPHFQPDWEKTQRVIPVFLAAVERVLIQNLPDYGRRAAAEFQRFARRTLQNKQLSKYEKEIRLQTELLRQKNNLLSTRMYSMADNAAIAGHIAQLQEKMAAAQKILCSMPLEDLTGAECRALHTIVQPLGDGSLPFSLNKVPFPERDEKPGDIPASLWALFDGQRNLLECIRMEDGEHDRFNEENGLADKKPTRTNDGAIKKILECLKFAEKYGYCRLHTTAGTLMPADFEKAIRKLGVKAGMNLAVHSAFYTLGRVEGGPDTICETFQKILGKNGTLLMPTFVFQLYTGKRNSAPYDVLQTPSAVGALGEAFRHRPGVLRSYDPCHPWAGWGKNAERYIANHHRATTVGPESPLGLLEKDNGWCMTISCMANVTFMHVVENSNHVPCLRQRTEEYEGILPDGQNVKLRTWSWRAVTCATCPAGRTRELFDFMRKHGQLRETMLGDAHICLFPLSAYRKAYESLLKKSCGTNPKARPRCNERTVPSDWNPKTQSPKKNTDAYIGEFLSQR